MQAPTQRCSCCGRTKRRAALHALDGGAYICRPCALWVAFRLQGDRHGR